MIFSGVALYACTGFNLSGMRQSKILVFAALATVLAATVIVVPASAQTAQVQSVPTMLGIVSIAFVPSANSQQVFMVLHGHPVQGGTYGITVYHNGEMTDGAYIHVPNGASTTHFDMSAGGNYDVFICPSTIGDSVMGYSCAVFVQNK